MLSYQNKVCISMISGMFWIYFREHKHYRGLPNRSILSAVLVAIWIYCNYIEPLSLPIGLLLMWVYSNYTEHDFSL
jgi:hypothetical protein